MGSRVGLSTRYPALTDGLYRVSTPHLCAGFVIRDSKVTECAPILRKRLAYWMTVAERVNMSTKAGEANFSATCKIGTGYDAPLVTLRGDTWDEFVKNAQDALGEEEGKTVAQELYRLAFTRATQMGQAVANVTRAMPGSKVLEQPTSPPAQQQADPVNPPNYPGDCPHGPRKYVESNTTKGMWRRWECANRDWKSCKSVNAK